MKIHLSKVAGAAATCAILFTAAPRADAQSHAANQPSNAAPPAFVIRPLQSRSLQNNLSPDKLINFFHFSGSLRGYVFNKNFTGASKRDQRSKAVSGILNVTTSPVLGGFSIGLSVFEGLNLTDMPSEIKGKANQSYETTLIGTKAQLTALDQAYLQYKHGKILMRLGDQIINTPWMSARDSRMQPQTYQGAWAQYAPLQGIKVMAGYVYAFQSRDSSSFHRDNLYYPTAYDGDQIEGSKDKVFGSSKLPHAQGTFVIGLDDANPQFSVQAWYYNFMDFAQAGYFEGGYKFGDIGSGARPYIDAQYLRETSAGGNYLARYDASLFGKTGSVNVNLMGARGGVKLGNNDISVAFDQLANSRASFGGGAIVTPYGDNGAMFAGVMSNHLDDFGPGNATQVTYKGSFISHRLKFEAAFVSFNTTYDGHPLLEYLDATYKLPGVLRGLSIRDRMALTQQARLADGASTELYNRVMLQYAF